MTTSTLRDWKISVQRSKVTGLAAPASAAANTTLTSIPRHLSQREKNREVPGPEAARTRGVTLLRRARGQTLIHSRIAITKENSVNASIKARAMRSVVLMSPAASGCRDMAFIAVDVAQPWLMAEAMAGSIITNPTARRCMFDGPSLPLQLPLAVDIQDPASSQGAKAGSRQTPRSRRRQ